VKGFNYIVVSYRSAESVMWRGLVFGLGALTLLAGDFAIFPDFVENAVDHGMVSARDLVNGEIVTVGKYRLHTLTVSMGRITDEGYVRKLGPKVNGLAVSAFSATETDRVGIGSLAQSVKAVLPAEDADSLVALIANSPSFTPGQVQVLKLARPGTPGPLSGIDVVLVLRAQRGDDREAKEALRVGLTELLDQAGKHSVTGLLLPTLTVAPEDENTPSFDDFFRFLFESLQASGTPAFIDISFFSGWPTDDLEEATAAFNAHWGAETRDWQQVWASLHRFQLRLVLVGLAICLMVSGRYTKIGFKSAAILAIAYALMLLGSFKSVETLTEGFGVGTRNLAFVAIMFVTAIGFPHIVRWSARDLFYKER
jgi:hypothetical protein